MPPGKLAAQAGHAYTDALWACLDQAPERALAYRTTGIGGSKVTIQAKNLGQLERAARECADAGIPHAVITDSEHVLLPHFTGAPIVTALGIGPVSRDQCRHITKRFQSVQGQSSGWEDTASITRITLMTAATIIKEMQGSGVEADMILNDEGGIHLSWTGERWEVEAGIERDGRFDWVYETQGGAINQSDGLIAPSDAVMTVQRILADVTQDDTMLLQTERLAHV